MLKSFFVKYSIFTIILILIFTFPFLNYLDAHLQKAVLMNFILFFLLGFFSTFLLLKSVNKQAENFQKNFLLILTGKILIAVVYFIIVYKPYLENLIIFAGSFFLAYILFTIFEISFIVVILRKK